MMKTGRMPLLDSRLLCSSCANSGGFDYPQLLIRPLSFLVERAIETRGNALRIPERDGRERFVMPAFKKSVDAMPLSRERRCHYSPVSEVACAAVATVS